MKYTKPPLSIPDQALLLIGRGMGGDRRLLESQLASVNYYRLSGYWFPFRNSDDTFQPGTTFETVWDRYIFDRQLRLLAMDAIERIEIAVRSLLAYHHSHVHGPFAFVSDNRTMPKLKSHQFRDFTARVRDEVNRSHERFVKHFRVKYSSSPDLPIWMATEVMSFGTVLTLFRGSTNIVKQNVASAFGMPHAVFASWLLTLNTVRNICAHHSRLWNRTFGVKPTIPLAKTYPHWHVPVAIKNDKVFGTLTICRHCLFCVAPQSKWRDRLKQLLADHPEIPIKEMGFPNDWQTCPIWSA